MTAGSAATMTVQEGSAATMTIHLFKNVLEAISDLSNEAYFEFSVSGLYVQAVDSSSSALASILLDFKDFKRYSCHQALSVGLSLAGLSKAFRYAKNDDILTIKAVDDSNNTVTFTFELTNGLILDHYLGCVDIDGPFEIKDSPESEYQAIVHIPSAMFMRICNAFSSFGDTVVISVDEERVKFFTQGETGIPKAFVCLQTHSVDQPEEHIRVDMKEELSLTFQLRHLNLFSKASTLSNQVKISLSSKQPAVFEYEIAHKSYIRYYMMPLIEEDEM